MRRCTSLVAALCFSGLLMAQSPAELAGVFEQYLAGVKAKDFRKVVSLYRGEMKQEILEEYTTSTDQAGFLEDLAEAAPDSHREPSVSRTGDGKILLRMTASKAVPKELQKEQNLPAVFQSQVEVEFIQENGQWKMGALVSRPPVAAQPRAVEDLKMGRRADYDEDSGTEVSGPIVRSEKQSIGTVYVIRADNDEIAVFVPSKLVQPGFTKGTVLVFEGASHPEDGRKLWAVKARLKE